jgi:uncharacterized membrane protein
MDRKRGALLSRIVSLAVAASGCAATDCSFRGIGDLPGGFAYPGQSALSSADDVSGDGSKVVGYGTGEDLLVPNEIKGAIGWTRHLYGAPFYPGAPKGIVALGYLAAPGNPAESYAGAISEDGLVAAGYSTGAPSNKDRPVRWTNGVIDEVTLPTGDDTGQVIDASFDGSRLVGFSSADPLPKAETSLRRAVLWTRFPGGYDALVLPHDLAGTSANASQAHGISRHAGAITGIVYDTNAGGRTSAFWPAVWTVDASGAYVLAPLFDTSGALANAWASEISADGLVVVGSLGVWPANQACRWVRASTSSPFGPAELLGALPGSTSAFASAASAGGDVIVGVSVNAEGTVPFVWDPSHGMRPLAAVIASAGASLPKGWRLETALSISADASTVIGGCVTDQGNPEGFVFRCGTRTDPAAWIRPAAATQ